MLNRLITRLNRVFNKEPTSIKVLTVTGPGSVVVAAETLTLSGTVIDLSTVTLTQLVTAINNVAGHTAALVDAEYGGLRAWGMLPTNQLISEDPSLTMASAFFYQEMQVYARLLEQQISHITDATRQMYLHTATDTWLDTWGAMYFGIARYPGELDAAYSARIVQQLLRPTQNNKALEQIVWDAMALQVSILDAAVYTELLAPEDVASAPGKFILDMSISGDPAAAAVLIQRVKDLANRHKAAGTDFFNSALRRLQTISETVAVSETLNCLLTTTISESMVPGSIFYGAGWVYGTPGVTFGENDAMTEQLIVQKINDGSGLTEQTVLGGN